MSIDIYSILVSEVLACQKEITHATNRLDNVRRTLEKLENSSILKFDDPILRDVPHG